MRKDLWEKMRKKDCKLTREQFEVLCLDSEYPEDCPEACQ